MYTPRDVPRTPDALPSFLRDELQTIAQSITSQVPFLFLQTLNEAPAKVFEGLIVRADGTHWDPGSGSGFYGFRNGAWHLLG